MDDHDLGALLDATVPTAPASDTALARIRRRATRHRRRAAVAAGAFSIAIAAAAAIGVSSLGARRVAPAGSTTSGRGGTTTIVPDGRCFSGDVSLTIGTAIEQPPGTTRWPIVARSRAENPCHPLAPIKATLLDSHDRILTAVAGTSTAALTPIDGLYPSELLPDAPTVVAYVVWEHPCSTGPVELDVNGFSPSTARLKLGRQQCTPSTTSRFDIKGAPPVSQGATCPLFSIDLSFTFSEGDVRGLATGRVTADSRVPVLCRTHTGVEVALESRDGRVLTDIPGNPAVEGDTFPDLFRPATSEHVADITWKNPCTTAPAVMVVRFDGIDYAPAIHVNLPKEPCIAGPVDTSRLQVTAPVAP